MAVCVCGLQRSLLTDLVVSRMRTHVLAPLRSRAVHVDTFVVVTDADSEDKGLSISIEAAYSPRELALTRRKLAAAAPCKLAHGKGWYTDRFPTLTQWLGFETCYGLVARAEYLARAEYDWIVRTRSDLVWFSPFALPTDRSFAYVNKGGMSNRAEHRCMGDHVFVCPRAMPAC